jgi:hypothetical protein
MGILIKSKLFRQLYPLFDIIYVSTIKDVLILFNIKQREARQQNDYNTIPAKVVCYGLNFSFSKAFTDIALSCLNNRDGASRLIHFITRAIPG